MKTGFYPLYVIFILLVGLNLAGAAVIKSVLVTDYDFSNYDRRHADPDFIAPVENPDKLPAVTALASEIELDSFINATMEAYHIPGVAVSIVKNGEIYFSKGYGWANIEQQVPATDTTSFMLASVSKTITGLALMHLHDNGRFELDDNINDYLPFPLINPHFPDDTITFHQVLTHTTSFRDNWDVMFSTYCDGDTPWPLEEYVQAYFLPGGMFYDESDNYYYAHPGTFWSYCNHNFVLAGYLVQAISGMLFEDYCRDSLFVPLGMTHTGCFLRELDTANVAMPYHWNGSGYTALGLFGYADFPAGALRSSALDLARHLLVFLGYGEYNGTRIIDSTTVVETMTQQCPVLYNSQGLVWFLSSFNEYLIWEHGGSDMGVKTLASFCPDLNTGVVVLTNGESLSTTQAIRRQLLEFSLIPLDSDEDGTENSVDNCPYTFNPFQEDIDSDGYGDSCDICILDYTNDGDGDGLCANIDNCPLVFNPGQEDSDSDGIGDACCCVGMRGNVDCSEDDEPDISDITTLIDFLYLSREPLCCYEEADANDSGGDPDIADITRLVDYLYLSRKPVVPCP